MTLNTPSHWVAFNCLEYPTSTYLSRLKTAYLARNKAPTWPVSAKSERNPAASAYQGFSTASQDGAM